MSLFACFLIVDNMVGYIDLGLDNVFCSMLKSLLINKINIFVACVFLLSTLVAHYENAKLILPQTACLAHDTILNENFLFYLNNLLLALLFVLVLIVLL